ncbi:HEPN domain-containing protein [Thermodesulfovibrionales bacterium]|nr:HEPN domain-containing protein [Thermodesulfovibrionales bacterium]
MKQHEAWLLKAENDLKSAKKLMQGDEPLPDTAMYHTQQCAEKTLKAYLSYKQHPIQKTHNLSVLVEICCGFDKKFEELFPYADVLTPYGIVFRYPDFNTVPDEQDVSDAVEISEKILVFVKKLIPLQLGKDDN